MEKEIRTVSIDALLEYKSCQARALAMELGEYVDSKKVKNELIRGYILASLDDPQRLEAFKEEHKEIMFASKKPFGLLKEFQIADTIAETIKADQFLMKVFSGEHQVNLGTQIRNVVITNSIDSIDKERGTVVMLAVLTGLANLKYNHRLGKEISQLADEMLEHGILRSWFSNYLAKQEYGKDFYNYYIALSKENTPEKELVRITSELLEARKDEFLELLDLYVNIHAGNAPAINCGHCEYCKSHKLIEHSVTVEELVGMSVSDLTQY